jgi:rod shape-determining protein MreC
VREGDVLVSSGLGERFPAGFPVAEVSRVDRETGESFMSVDARPLAALDRGLEVLLVQPDPVAAAEPELTEGGADELTPDNSTPAQNDVDSAGDTAVESAPGPGEETPEEEQ